MDRKHRTGHRTHVGSKDRYAAGMKDKLVARANALELELVGRGFKGLVAGREGFKMLREFKNLSVDGCALDEAIALSVFGKGLAAEYASLQMPVPEWLTDRQAVLRNEINARRRDDLARQLKEAKIAYDRLTPAGEKREQLKATMEALEKQLNPA